MGLSRLTSCPIPVQTAGDRYETNEVVLLGKIQKRIETRVLNGLFLVRVAVSLSPGSARTDVKIKNGMYGIGYKIFKLADGLHRPCHEDHKLIRKCFTPGECG